MINKNKSKNKETTTKATTTKKNGKSCLDLAVRKDFCEIVKIIIDKGGDPNSPDLVFFLLLLLVVIVCFCDIVKVIMETL